MASYATVDEVAAGFRTLSEEEEIIAEVLLEEAAELIDAYASATIEANIKKLVSKRMVRRALQNNAETSSFPMGATQGSMSALGYSQSFTFGDGSAGQLYFNKDEKKLLRINNKMQTISPLEGLVNTSD